MSLDSETGRFHARCVADRLSERAVRAAFETMMQGLRDQSRFDVAASPRGAFSEINLRLDGRRYYAFRGTRAWIAWYFRKPAFDMKLVDCNTVRSQFADLSPFENPRAQEIWVKITSPKDAQRVLNFIL